MCGFLGKISKNNFDFEKFEIANDYQTCRGPDQKKIFNNLNSNFFNDLGLPVSLIFNRLSIIDLSDDASQPMINKARNTLVMFNGEIFNHRILRKEMESQGIKFKTSHSDTEVVLNGLSNFGIDYIKNFIGQFSIFFLDLNKRKVFLVRDRVGQKPLFYNINKNEISFSSNLKSLVRSNNFYEIDENQVFKYLQLGVVPSPNTIFKNYNKLEPGEYLEFNLDTFNFSKYRYWNIEESLDNKNFDYRYFINLFEDAVNLRLESDVPLATFLSGGLDSTAIAKATQAQGKINTFSMNFQNSKYDEKKWSDVVAQKYQTDHETHLLKSSLTFDKFVEVIDILDEPYADISLIPTYFLSKSISENYKVAISGDGGDELVFGYDHSNISLKSSLKNYPSYIINTIFSIYPAKYGSGNRFLSKNSNLNVSYPSFFEDNKLLRLMKLKIDSDFSKNYLLNHASNDKQIMIADYKFYLSELMLLKIDRASMANSLEIRSPFVDHRLIEYMVSVNLQQVTQNYTERKAILKKYLASDFDDNFLNRKKMGFAFDIETWIFQNLEQINEIIKNGQIIYNFNSELVSLLAQRSSRINAHRLWKLLLLEVYIDNI